MLLLVLSLEALATAPTGPHIPCATAHLMGGERPVQAVVPTAPPERDEKRVQSGFPALSNMIETDNFAIWWGSADGFDTTDVVELGTAFERAWDTQVRELEFPQPPITHTQKFNVYIGDTGGPSSLGANGYYFYDDNNDPMIVIAASLVGEPYGNVTAAHEWFHAVQDGVDTYVYADQAAWYFEATAVWMEAKVYPDSTDYTKFIPSIAFLPELSINYFSYPERYSLDEFHHYGASLFIKHLDDRFGTDLIRDSWLNTQNNDPLDAIHALLKDHHSSLDAVFFDYFTRNITWDYPDKSAIEDAIENAGGYDDIDSHRPTGHLRLPIQTSVTANRHPPRNLGGNYWRLYDVPERFTLTLDPSDRSATWFVVVASDDGYAIRSETFTLTGEYNTLEFTGHQHADTVWLGIGVSSGEAEIASPYSLQLDRGPSHASRSAAPSSCGCASQSHAQGWPLMILLLRRRRL